MALFGWLRCFPNVNGIWWFMYFQHYSVRKLCICSYLKTDSFWIEMITALVIDVIPKWEGLKKVVIVENIRYWGTHILYSKWYNSSRKSIKKIFFIPPSAWLAAVRRAMYKSIIFFWSLPFLNLNISFFIPA